MSFVEEWRGAYRISLDGLLSFSLRSFEDHDGRGWTLFDAEDSSLCHSRRLLPLAALLPLGYGDRLVSVTDQHFPLVDARPGDVLVFRYARQVQAEDLYLKEGSAAAPMELLRAADSAGLVSNELVLISHVRRLA